MGKAGDRRLLVWIVAGIFFIAAAACSNAAVPGIEIGRELYARDCQTCHGDAATGEGAVLGAPVHGPTGHTWHHADGQIVDIILGRFDYPGRTMPSFQGVLSDDDAQAILGYLKAGWESRQLAFQEEVSRNWEELE